MEVLKCCVEIDDMVKTVSTAFDYNFTGESTFTIPEFDVPKEYQIGLIVGPSGSGKTNILKRIGTLEDPKWNDAKAICSHFNKIEELHAVGLNSIPTICRPYYVCSTGEKHRADMARQLKNNAVIDEFTSVVDRNVAKSLSNAIHRYIKKEGLQKITFATCHYDIIEWLRPDWVFDTATGELTRGVLRQRPTIALEVIPADKRLWSAFAPHHYLSGSMNKSARCWAALWNEIIVGFCAVLRQPSGTIKEAYRGHRTVVLPDFQGLGIGVRFSDAVAQMYVDQGKRYFSKTANPRMGEYRENSPLWKPTSKNKVVRNDYKKYSGTDEWRYVGYSARWKKSDKPVIVEDSILQHANRICYSHEYIGLKK